MGFGISIAEKCRFLCAYAIERFFHFVYAEKEREKIPLQSLKKFNRYIENVLFF